MSDAMRPEYDITGGERGKYVARSFPWVRTLTFANVLWTCGSCGATIAAHHTHVCWVVVATTA